MPKYYSPSTGQVSDTPPGVGGTSNPISSGGGMMGGGDISQLQQLLGLGAMMKKDYTGAANLLIPQQTAEQKNRKIALHPARLVIQRVLKDNYRDSGPQLIPANLALKYLGGLGVPSHIKAQKTRFALLKQNVVRAMQGARMSDTDIRMASEYIPDITDTPDTIKVKLKTLNEVLNDMTGE